MNVNWKFVAGALALIVAYDEIALLKNAKTTKAIQSALRRQNMRVSLLASKLDDLKIPMDDFDEIALATIRDM